MSSFGDEEDDDDDGWEDLPLPSLNSSIYTYEEPTALEVSVQPSKVAKDPAPSTSLVKQELPRRSLQTISSPSSQKSQFTSKKSIVSHPLEYVSSNFLWHLGRQLWLCDWSFRTALALLSIGTVLRCLLLSFYLYLYPRYSLMLISLVSAVGIPWIMWNRKSIEATLVGLLCSDSFWRDRLHWIESSLTSSQLRIIAGFVMYGIPTLLEMETYHFLANLVGMSTAAAAGFSLCMLAAAKQNFCAIHLLTTGLYLLYAAALWIVMVQKQERRHIPLIASRFCWATAVLLFQHSASSGTQLIQTALRLTVRDSLERVSNTVRQDELLQLTMLRWIVDYWSTGETSRDSSQQAQGEKTTSNPASTQQQKDHKEEEAMSWNELGSMLQSTAKQMNNEVESLQTSQLATGTTPPVEPNPNSTNKPAHRSVPKRRVSQQVNVTQTPSPFGDLQAMFAAMDIDDSAKPTVLAYKKVVETLPPKQTVAISLSVFRRLPATALFFCMLFTAHGGILGTFLLLHFVGLEGWRLFRWVRKCRTEIGKDDSSAPNLRDLQDVDPMVLLLVDEQKTGSLLPVWRNIQSSVSALEASLTAARAMQTTVIAADFCANMISLANFGVEVSERGWLHGVQVLVRELVHLHSTGTPIDSLTHGMASPDGTVTSAAVSAIRNSERMSRNVQALASEESAGQVVGSVLAVVPLIVGQGWLWGRSATTPATEDGLLSQVTIEEVIEEVNTPDDQHIDTVDHVIGNTPANEQAVIQTLSEDGDVASSAINSKERPLDASWGSFDNQDTASSKEQDGKQETFVARSLETTSAIRNMVETTNNVEDLGSVCRSVSLQNNEDERIVANLANGDSDDSFETLEGLQLGPSATLAVTHDTDRSSADDDDENGNIWLKVGSGLAVVGAVIGAAAVTHHNLSEGKRRERSEGDKK